MRVLVLQVSVGPDQALGGEDHPVSGLLELLQQLLGARGEDHVVAVGGGRERQTLLRRGVIGTSVWVGGAFFDLLTTGPLFNLLQGLSSGLTAAR